VKRVVLTPLKTHGNTRLIHTFLIKTVRNGRKGFTTFINDRVGEGTPVCAACLPLSLFLLGDWMGREELAQQ